MAYPRRRLRPALLVRAAWAVLLLVMPGRLVTAADGTDEKASRRVVRVLGVRHAVEAAVEVAFGGRTVAAGAVVDALHALTAVAFGAADPRWRRPALTDAVVAASFAMTGRREAASRR